MLANDTHGVALVNQVASRGDKTLDGRNVHVFHMSDGKMTELGVSRGSGSLRRFLVLAQAETSILIAFGESSYPSRQLNAGGALTA